MVNPRRFYTYAYLRKNGTPYYIGKGTKYRAYDKSGRTFPPPKDKSRIILLKQNLTEEEAFKHEIYMIAVFGRIDLGTGILHNRTNGGEGTSGVILSEKTLQKKRENGKKRVFTEKTRRKMSESFKGRKNSYEARLKISKALTGRKLSKEHLEKLKNKKLSEEHKKKISISLKGRIITKEARLKISNFHKGRKLSKEHIEKVKKTKLKNGGKYIYTVISPNLEIYETSNLRQFCINNNLHASHMYAICKGKLKHYKKWTVTKKLKVKI